MERLSINPEGKDLAEMLGISQERKSEMEMELIHKAMEYMTTVDGLRQAELGHIQACFEISRNPNELAFNLWAASASNTSAIYRTNPTLALMGMLGHF